MTARFRLFWQVPDICMPSGLRSSKRPLDCLVAPILGPDTVRLNGLCHGKHIAPYPARRRSANGNRKNQLVYGMVPPHGLEPRTY